MKRSTVAALAVAVSAPLTALRARADLTADQTPFHTYRGLWVSRFEYTNTQAGVDAVFANAQALGITDVMFQVRGAADAYYTPKTVGGNYFEHRTNTSFDALARAVEQGHQRGIKVHAWLNAMPLHSGPTLPTNQPGNPYVVNTHPEYWIRDRNNATQPLNSSYVIVNPTQPDVKQHIWDVVDDITSKYALDGIHLDYIRYYHDTSSASVNFGADPASVARFQAIPGNAGKTPSTHKAEYQAWMAANVTELVAGIRQTMKDNRPAAQLTAAIWRDANIGYNGYQQDWKTWVDRGLLDAGMPMIYRKGFGSGGTNMDADSGNLYRNNVTAAVNWRGTAGIMPGLGIYLQDNAATAYNNVTAQLNFARDQGANGVQLFSYTDLLGGDAVDQQVRQAWLDFLAANNAPPPVASVTDFEADEGYFPTNITFSGSNVNVAASSTADRTTDDAHGGAASQKLTINKAGAGTFLARHVAGIGTPAAPASNLELASIGAAGFWLKTAARDVEVALAVDDNTANTSTERSYFQNVIPDGQWHYYQWFLNDPTHWDAWAGASADGTVESRFTLDSIQFRGSEDANVLFLDDVEFDATAVAADQWTLDSSINANSANNDWHNSANWQGGVPDAPGAVANFFRRATTAQTVNVDGAVTVGAIAFDNSAGYTLAGPGSITMDSTSGSASITVRNRGAHDIDVPVTLADALEVNVDHKATLNVNGALQNAGGRAIVKSGDGSLNVNGAQAHGPGSSFTAVAGITNFNTDAGGGGAAHLLVAASNAGTRVNLNAPQHLAGLSVTGGAVVDAKDNAVTIDYAGASPASDVRSMLAAGGLTSSLATAQLGLGYFDDGDTVRIDLTRLGDADLNFTVNLADFNALASNFGGSDKLWQQGDFNYDGNVNLADFNLLAANFGLAAGGPDVTPQDWSALASAVPEPGAALIWFGVGGSAAVCRRARRRKLTRAG